MTLTKVQKQNLEELKENGKLYIGYNSPSIMRTFSCLVEKGCAEVVKESVYGKWFAPIEV